MLKNHALLLLAVLVALASQHAAAAEPVRVMSFNIRYGTADDGENSWPHRKSLVVDVIEEEAADLVGLQEALRDQIDLLLDELPEYGIVGAGRNAEGDGEYSAIMYRQSRFDVSDAGTFWLSDTPHVAGSTTWGNNLPRICTWVRLFDRETGRRLLYLNTHWDHESQPARLGAGQLMARRVAEMAAEGEPVIVTGDFNAAPENPALVALLQSCGLNDSFRAVHPDETNVGTFNGFGEQLNSRKIDAVLASSHWKVEDAAIVRTQDEGRYPSDHFPVTATLTLPEAAPAEDAAE